MMKIFDKSMKDEMLKVADGEKYIFDLMEGIFIKLFQKLIVVPVEPYPG